MTVDLSDFTITLRYLDHEAVVRRGPDADGRFWWRVFIDGLDVYANLDQETTIDTAARMLRERPCSVCGHVGAGHTCCPPPELESVPVGRKYILRKPKRQCNDCGRAGELRYVCVGVGNYVDLCRDCELEREAAHREVRR